VTAPIGAQIWAPAELAPEDAGKARRSTVRARIMARLRPPDAG